MKRTACLFFLITGLLVGGTAASDAASFDCGKASSSTERLICGHRELGVRDEMMAKLYAAERPSTDPDQPQP